jgi:small conductance mechanosensitive channel
VNGSGDFSEILRSLSGDNLIQVGLIMAAAWIITALIQRMLPWLADRLTGRAQLYVLAAVPVLRLIIILGAIILIIPRLIEPTFENLIALLGALGLALGFAFKDYASSLIAGVVALFEMPYRPGDWITVDDAYGEVRAINMRTVEIVTPDDTVVIIPHLKLWNQPIFNANDGGRDLLCVAHFYLQPRHNAARVQHTLYDVALTSAFLQIEQPINVIVRDEPWGTHYCLKAYPIDPRQQFHFVSDLTIRGKAALLALGVDFAAPYVSSEHIK